MPSVTDHCAAGSIGLVALYSTDNYLPTHELVWGMSFFFGNLLPDISNFFYAWVAKKRGYEIRIFDPLSWDEKLFEQIDSEWKIVHPYKWLHSFPVWLCVLAIALPLPNTHYFTATTYGCLIHVVMDGPLHERNWLFWPLPSFRGFCDWWRSRLFTSKAWRTVSIGVVLSFVFFQLACSYGHINP